MARTQRLIRTFTLLPFLFLFFATGTDAQTAPVNVTVWNTQGFNQSPPLPPPSEPVGEYVTDVVWHNFDAQPVMGLVDDFVVRFEGFISTDVDAQVRFYAPADDGVRMYLSEQIIIDDWYDKGGGGSISPAITFTAGIPQPFTLWYYENGGGAWVQLWWNTGQDWQPVPMSAFTGQTTTTSTSAPTTTELSTTTTEEPQTTTTSSLPATILPEPTTTLEQTTTTIPSPITTTSQVVVESTTTNPIQVQTSLPVQTSVPVQSPTTLPQPVATSEPEQPQPQTTTTQPIQEQTSLPPTEEYQSAMLVNGGVIGKGLKPVALISNGLREGVSPSQQRMVVTASVLIAIPSPIGATRRKA
jgi:hypothetical protein